MCSQPDLTRRRSEVDLHAYFSSGASIAMRSAIGAPIPHFGITRAPVTADDLRDFCRSGFRRFREVNRDRTYRGFVWHIIQVIDVKSIGFS
jgi:hypothetical protein